MWRIFGTKSISYCLNGIMRIIKINNYDQGPNRLNSFIHVTYINLSIMTVNATVLFFPCLPPLDYMLGLRDLTTFPMEKKNPEHWSLVFLFWQNNQVQSPQTSGIIVPCRWSNSPRKRRRKRCVYPAITVASLFAVVPVHKSEVSQGSGGQRLSHFAFVVREQGVPSDSRAHLWRLSAGRCSRIAV